jgi:hypothetical protein
VTAARRHYRPGLSVADAESELTKGQERLDDMDRQLETFKSQNMVAEYNATVELYNKESARLRSIYKRNAATRQTLTALDSAIDASIDPDIFALKFQKVDLSSRTTADSQ